MDEDSERGSQRSMPKRDGHARHQLDDKSPSGVPNPLPRRSAQGHLEPQLRHPRGSGTGTPFAAFAAKNDAAGDNAARKAAATNDAADDGGNAGAAENAATNGSAARGSATNGSATNCSANGSATNRSAATDNAVSQESEAVDASACAAETSRPADFRKGARRGHHPTPGPPPPPTS